MFLFNLSNGDPNRPSFFEMFAQFQMMPSFKPALKYIFTVLSQRNSKFLYIVKYYDECFYSMLLLLEYHYLKYYEGSFSENFYNLKRVKSEDKKGTTLDIVKRLLNPVGVDAEGLSKSELLRKSIMMMRKSKQTLMTSNSEAITNRDRKISLIFLVLIPYIKTKLDDLYRRESDPLNELGIHQDDQQPPLLDEHHQQPIWNRLKKHVVVLKLLRSFRKFFLQVYPFLSGFYESLFFLYQLLYLYEYTNFYTPFLHTQKINLKRLTHQDTDNHNQLIANRRNDRINMVRNWPMPYLFIPLVKVLDSILDYSKFILPASVFLFKSLEWWYSENRQSAPTLPVIPPPLPPKQAKDGMDIPDDKSLCPICREKRTNATICGSGFVYCYRCIHQYVSQYSRCPITFLPANIEGLRKIYESEQ
ncbi:RING zinc finger-containing protein [Tieghemostelium lacteum]|uniref:Peroxin-12 n=1 Tax=Tieghemostelium lacteum TaxID=361077 RepID=A0A151Z7L7_TIELA|nr:RING zinc finger-containing protein [Tieghemostelium lacteum]|eukprot:KYQ89925.1 RING zinc finger-containing protein [Tieghemostelium lacteum]